MPRINLATMEEKASMLCTCDGDVVQNRGKKCLSRIVIVSTAEEKVSSCCARATAKGVLIERR